MFKLIMKIAGGVIAASIIDLGYMFYSRSQIGANLGKAGWHATTLGHGSYKYNVMPKTNLFKGGKSF